ncbi:deoxyribodipyrimidine photo-lyase, partial [Sipha flava]|uniref:Deoxyribodipyrimidine photo-lyase n=1 Tax=Sipha flava TaxID=143950 RepID=A0A8B8FUM4_9HEMI
MSDGSPPTKKLKKPSTDISSSKNSDFLKDVANERKKVATSIMDFKFNKKRLRVLSKMKEVPEWADGVIYWTFRDERVHDNWALLFAQKLAIKNKISLHITFCRLQKFLDCSLRHYKHIFQGLEELESECNNLNIQFHFLIGCAADILPDFVKKHKLGAIVVDFMPVREHMLWTQQLAERIGSVVPVIQVDAHNIVPCWVASDKQEYAARTIRNKINNKLPEYLTEFPPVIKHPFSGKLKAQPTNWDEADKTLEVDRTVLPVPGLKAGYKAGMNELENFIQKRLAKYSSDRNNPLKDGLSKLSPWLHFGQISAQRCILEVSKLSKKFPEAVAAYREEAIVRRELSDNFCFYNPKYDSIEGASSWAITTLNDHRKDKRKYVYTREELEKSRTHDDLWNSAQIQLVKDGKMHGFLRMYWAKKILEWTDTPERALAD